MRSKNISYIPALDHLRGFAAILILLYHGFHLISYPLAHGQPFSTSPWPQPENPLAALIVEGHTAVALFMVLSGFIFTVGAYGHKINYKNFVLNRILRTFPLFIVMVFAAMEINPASEDLFKFFQTILTFSQSPNAVHGDPFSIMFWAISVEWQFYLLFPFLLVIFQTNGTRVFIGMIAVMLIFRWLLASFDASPRDLSYWSIWGRLDQFLIGMIAARLYQTSFKKSWLFDLLALLSAGGLVAYLWMFNQLGGWPVDEDWKVITPTIEGLLWAGFILGYLSFSRWVPPFIAFTIKSVGIVSYSIYLLHYVVVVLVVRNGYVFDYFHLGPVGDALATTVIYVLPATLVLSALTYNFIEKPFLALRRNYRADTSPKSATVETSTGG